MVEAAPGQVVAVEAAATMVEARARVEAAATAEPEPGQAVAVEEAALVRATVTVDAVTVQVMAAGEAEVVGATTPMGTAGGATAVDGTVGGGRLAEEMAVRVQFGAEGAEVQSVYQGGLECFTAILSCWARFSGDQTWEPLHQWYIRLHWGKLLARFPLLMVQSVRIG